MSMENSSAGITALRRFSDRLNVFCEMALFLSFVVMTFVTLLQIICRIFFEALTWSEELTCFLLVLASFLGVTVGIRRGAHISIMFLVDKLPAPLKRGMFFFSSCVTLVFFGVIGWYGSTLAWEERLQQASAVNISMGVIYLVFPFTAVVVLVHVLAFLQESIRGAK